MEIAWQTLKRKSLEGLLKLPSNFTTKNYQKSKKEPNQKFSENVESKTLTKLAILGWTILVILLWDAFFNRSRIIMWLVAGTG